MNRDRRGIRIRPGGIGGIGDFDPIACGGGECRRGEAGGVRAHRRGRGARYALIPLVSERLGADGGDGEGCSGATGDGDGCRVGEDPRIGHGHRRVALPGRRGEAGLAGEVIDGEAGGGAGEYGRAYRRRAAEEKSRF